MICSPWKHNDIKHADNMATYFQFRVIIFFFFVVFPIRNQKSQYNMSLTTWREESLMAHNQYRKQHHCPPLELRDDLNKEAQRWAEELAKLDRMKHQTKNEYGENLYYKESSSPLGNIKGSEAIDSWYSEIKDYQFGKEPSPSNLKAGHFTQLIWKNSKYLGMGQAKTSNNKKVYIVAEYHPKGNIMGKFIENTPKQ